MTAPDRRADAIERVRAAAWDEGKPCEHCGGEGRVSGGRRLVHSYLGGLGADWDEDSIVALIQRAESCQWAEGFLGHDLLVIADGKRYAFQVKRPEPVSTAEDAKAGQS
jgi:hypothetical protein